jgi:ATP-binding cassette subfamily A (ABC1) protein 3
MSIIKEKENKLKHLQILSGLSLLTYWLNNYIFELLKYAVISVFSYIILIIFNFEEKYLIVLYILYGPAMISFTYCVSYFIEKEGQGQTIALLINLLFGTLGSSAILILRTNEDAKNIGKILSIFFRIIPSFCMSYGYNELISKNSLYVIDNHIDEINNQDYIVNISKMILSF